jgi:cell division protein FtsQ
VAVAGPNRRRVDRVPGERRRALGRALQLVLPALLSAAAVVGAGWLVYRHGVEGDLLRIREIRFEGLARVTPEELLELSPVHAGDHLLLTDLAPAKAALARHPWLASVEVRRRLPPALEVRVVERRAVALVDLNGLYLVDARGEVFKRAAPGDGLDLPVVTGLAREDWVDRRAELQPVLQGALGLLARWRERGLEKRAPLSQIRIDPVYGATAWAGEQGFEVRLGHGDLAEKLSRLERVLAAVEAEGQRPEVLHLDNRRRPEWVAVRLASARGGGGGPASGGSPAADR